MTVAKSVILTLAAIKAKTEAFDRGDVNAFDALDAIIAAIEAYRAEAEDRRRAA